MLVTQPDEIFTVASAVEATVDVTATQPGEAPGMRGKSAPNMTATDPLRLLVQEDLPPSLLRLPVRGWPPSLLRFLVLSLMCNFNLPVPVVKMAVLLTSPSPVLELLLGILVCLTQKMRWLVNRNPMLQKVTRKCCRAEPGTFRRGELQGENERGAFFHGLAPDP